MRQRGWATFGMGGLLLCVAGGVAQSQAPAASPTEAAPAAAQHTALMPDDIKWGEPPPVFARGAKMAVLLGEPAKTGMFIVRLKVPANYKVAPHWHPTDESVTVISGSVAIAMGDNLDPAAKAYPAGSFFTMPAKMHHFAIAKKESIVEISGMGPFTLTYVNPADDPRKAAAK